jgi:hypothetical protein
MKTSAAKVFDSPSMIFVSNEVSLPVRKHFDTCWLNSLRSGSSTIAEQRDPCNRFTLITSMSAAGLFALTMTPSREITSDGDGNESRTPLLKIARSSAGGGRRTLTLLE